MPEPIAEWNPARCVWETGQGQLCGHSDVWSETWPTSGMTRGGVAYPLPPWEPHTSGTGSSLLPTPRVSDRKGPGRERLGFGLDLRTAVTLLPTPVTTDSKAAAPADEARNSPGLRAIEHLLPTPRTGDGTKGGPNQHGSSGDLMLPSAVARLLPTPTVSDKHSSGTDSPTQQTLTDVVVRTRLGARTNPRFDGGSESSDDPLLPLDS